MAVPATLTLRASMLARLDLVANLKVYDNGIRQNDPPDEIPGSGGAVAPYAVLHAGGGRGYSDRLVGGSSALSWSPQVTVVAGFPADCAAAVDRIRAEVTDKALVIADGVTGYLREVADPGNIRENDAVTPSRFWFPMIFSTVATP